MTDVVRVLISIDCLFDTLLACANDVQPGCTSALLNNGYHNRHSNKLSLILEGFDDAALLKAWNNRGTEVLRKSYRTHMVNVLVANIKRNNFRHEDDPDKCDLQFVINTYPYDLNSDELKELFLVFKEIFDVSKITRVHIPLNEITPEYLYGNYGKIILYDFNEWMHTLHLQLKDCKLKYLSVVVPFCFAPGQEETKYAFDMPEKIIREFSDVFEIEYVTLRDMSFSPPIEA